MNAATTTSSHELTFIIVLVAAIAALGLAIAYGTSRWNSRRKMREPGTVERAAGPAPRDAAASGSDDRRAR